METKIRKLIWLLAGATVVSFLGVYVSYNGPWLTSTAWQQWGHDQAWKADATRLVFISVFAAFLLLVSFLRRCQGVPEYYGLTLDAKNVAVFSVFLVAVCWLNFVYYPENFYKELLLNKYGYLSPDTLNNIKQDFFNEVYLPYFAYFFYSYGLWCGVILPAFIIFIRGFIYDYAKAKSALEEIQNYAAIRIFEEEFSQSKSPLAMDFVLTKLDDIKDHSQYALRNLSQRYLPAIFLVFIAYTLGSIMFSQGTGFDETFDYVSTMTTEARSSNSWVILIFVIICAVLVVYFSVLLSNFLDVLEYKLDDLSNHIDRGQESIGKELYVKYKKDIKDAQKNWTLKERNLIIYVYETIFKSGSIYIPLLASIVLLIWRQYLVSENVDVLLPTTIIEWIEENYLRAR